MRDLVLDEQDEVIVRSTIDLGRNLGMEVVAEGVESERVLERLGYLCCDMVQGSLISSPLSVDEFPRWLEQSSYKVRRRSPTSDVIDTPSVLDSPRGSGLPT